MRSSWLGSGGTPLIIKTENTRTIWDCRDLIPHPNRLFGGREVDMAFLLEVRDSGRLPDPPTMTAALKSQTELRLSVQQLPGPIPANLSCAVHTDSIELKPKVGDLYGFTTSILISLGEPAAPLAYNIAMQPFPVIRILRPDLTLHFSPKPPATSFGLCH